MMFEKIPVSIEIREFAYRNVLKIIKEKGCGYDEAWAIFEKEFLNKLTVQIEKMEATNNNRNKYYNKSKTERYSGKHEKAHFFDEEVCEAEIDHKKEPTKS